MKRLFSLFLAPTFFIPTVASVVSCGETLVQNDAYLVFQKTTYADDGAFSTAIPTKKSFTNQYIANDMVANMVIDVAQSEIDNYKTGDTIQKQTKNEIVKLLSSNLSVYDVLSYGQVLNPDKFTLTFGSKITQQEAGYFGFPYDDFYKITMSENSNTANTLELIVRLCDFDFEIMNTITANSFKQLATFINQDKFIW